MSNDSRVVQILEQMMDTGSVPEVACADFPELLPVVRMRWAQLNKVEAKLDAMFPACDGPDRVGPPLKRRPQIAGYEIGEVVGRGAVGVVYKARHLGLRRNVAVKMLLSGAYAGETELKRFRREAQTIAGLRHLNLVQVYDTGETEGCPYFTMELVEGGNLAGQLAGVPLPAQTAAALMSVVADAVHAAHVSGVIHRDLKPSNILLTTDGTPKVGDFGLARRIQDPSDLTRSGDRVGTPCYMAPEQARGRAGTVGPQVDVYSLGAILYEMLTGRPPFQGETPGETELQLLSVEPAPPSRLNAKVPRDLETICLKCLQKDPLRRYESAAALADDLRRFGRGDPIRARPAGWIERGIKWVRRHPAATVATVGAAVLVVALASGTLWVIGQRSANARALNDDLNQVQSLEAVSEWDQARLVQQRAKARLTAATTTEQRQRVGQNDFDLAMVARLDAIRQDRMGKPIFVAWAQDNTDKSNSLHNDIPYVMAFHDAGLGSPGDPPEVVAARIRSSNIRTALSDAVYDWIGSTDDGDFRDWTLQVAAMTDPAPSAWTRRAQDRKTWYDKAALKEVLDSAPSNPGSLRLTAVVANRLQELGGDGIPYLKKLQLAHPGDFRTNYTLAWACKQASQFDDAIKYAQAVVALRQDFPIMPNNLGVDLLDAGRLEQAVDQFRLASALEPDSWFFEINLAAALAQAGHYSESVETFRRGFQMGGPRDGNNVAWFAVSLEHVGRRDEAVEEFGRLVTKIPWLVHGTYSPVPDFIRDGRGETIRAAWWQGLSAGDDNDKDYDGYPELCLYLGKDKAYREACDLIVARFGQAPNPYMAERIGKSMLLVPGDAGRTAVANGYVDRALNTDPAQVKSWAPAHFQFAKSIAEYRLGHYQNTCTILDGPAGKLFGPAPSLLRAMAQFKLGHTAEAERAFRTAILNFDWTPVNAVEKEAWSYHVLRREAETMLTPNLPAFVAGQYQPGDNDERTMFLGYCEANRLHAATATICDALFAANRGSSTGTRKDLGKTAVHAAALAGSGKGADAAALSDLDRARFRGLALVWFKADLDAIKPARDGDTALKPASILELNSWRTDADFQDVRDPERLAVLPEQEREQWQAFWKSVDARIASSVSTVK